jgi:hypothetical protein
MNSEYEIYFFIARFKNNYQLITEINKYFIYKFIKVTRGIVKIINSSKNINITSTIILANIYKTNITKIKNIIFIILFIFNNVFRFGYDII